MIGLLLHLAARGLDTVRAELFENFEEFKAELGAECDALRAERDEARARVAELRGILRESRALTHEAEGERDDARTLAHEAKLEFSAARETCEQLRGELADWRGIAASEQREAAEVRVQLDELRALMRKFLIVREAYMSCDPGARADYNACLADMRAAVEEVTP